MPSAIGVTPPLPPSTSPRASQLPAELTLRLARSLGELLPPGQSATAEVLAVKEAQASFQLLLRLTMADGRQTLATAESPRALPQGSSLNIAALSPTSLAATLLSSSNEPPLDAIDLQQVPTGTLLQGKVLSSEPLDQAEARQPAYRILLRVLNTPLAGRQLSLNSAHPLPIGSLLSAQVQASQMLRFLPLSSRLERLDLSRQLAGQQSRQAALPALFDALQGLKQGSDLPQGLRTAVDNLLAGLPDARQLSDPDGLAQALQRSGGFLEARLLQGLAAQGDFKANLLRLVAQLLPALGATGPALPGSGRPAGPERALPALPRSVFGVPGARTEDGGFPLPGRLILDPRDDGGLEALLKLASAALARLQTHQLSSLVQSETLPDGTLLNTWQMEIPLRQQRSLVPIQVRIQEEQRQKDREPKGEILWHLELAFDLDTLGPLQIQACLAQGTLSSRIWAELGSTVSLIESELGHLRQRLGDAGLTVNQLSCSQGKPPRSQRTAVEQRWVDENA
ncbi:Flagellar hook-length control protein FliK [compost metagenome]